MSTLQRSRIRLVLVGYGRMGRAVEAACADHDFEVVDRLDAATNANGMALDDTDRWRDVDVAVDFSIAAAVPDNVSRLARLGIDTVVGTTGWSASEPALRSLVESSGIGVVAAPNFAPGVNAYLAIVEHAAAVLSRATGFEPWIHELHHAAKRDAPSGTALALRDAIVSRGNWSTEPDVASTRAGTIPGTHTVGFDARYETLTVTHTTRDRRVFAHGALLAARWVHGRRGWFGMRDVLGLGEEGWS